MLHYVAPHGSGFAVYFGHTVIALFPLGRQFKPVAEARIARYYANTCCAAFNKHGECRYVGQPAI